MAVSKLVTSSNGISECVLRLCPLLSQQEDSMKPLRPYERQDTLRQFLNHDGNVLRFYCYWDDTQSMYGDCRELILHYFLADDTIEILEVRYANSGRDTAPKFLHRSKLPKVRGRSSYVMV